MRTVKSKPIAIFIFAILAFAMTGCGKSKNGTDAAAPIPGGYYPQGAYPGGTAGGFASNPTPLSGPLTFGGVMYIDSANIYAGQGVQFPNSTYQTNTLPGNATYTGSGPFGQMVIQTVQQVGVNLYNVSGQIILSPQYVSTLMPYGYGGYAGVPTGQVVGINIGHYNTTLYGGGFGGSSAAKIRLSTGQLIDFFL